MIITKVISGGQSGADYAGIYSAKKANIPTGGWMPKGFLTEIGPRPEYAELYEMVQHPLATYPPRTFANVQGSDGTIRIAYDFNTAGEKCTFNAIKKYNKPYIDVNVLNPTPISEVKEWILQNNIKIVNIAGNRESTFQGITVFAIDYLAKLWGLCNEV